MENEGCLPNITRERLLNLRRKDREKARYRIGRSRVSMTTCSPITQAQRDSNVERYTALPPTANRLMRESKREVSEPVPREKVSIQLASTMCMPWVSMKKKRRVCMAPPTERNNCKSMLDAEGRVVRWFVGGSSLPVQAIMPEIGMNKVAYTVGNCTNVLRKHAFVKYSKKSNATAPKTKGP